MGLESNELSAQMRSMIEASGEIFFYSAGVSEPLTKQRVIDKLNAAAPVTVETDIVAACRALLGKEEGIVGILGTGCNACHWDGKEALAHVPSLGYILSDEGSGNDLGKELLRAYFYKEMPLDLAIKFEQDYAVTKQEVLENIYRKPYPNRYLASFTRFISQYEHEWLDQIVKFRFELYIQKHVLPNFHKKKENIAFVGSVAFVFKDILIELCKSKNLEVVNISKSATEGLIKFHTSSIYE